MDTNLTFNLTAELVVVGSIIASEADRKIALAMLKPEHFYREQHARIFRVVNELDEQGMDVDPVAVLERLPEDSGITLQYLTNAIDESILVPAGHLEAHCEQVIECWRRRKIIQICDAAKACARANPDENGLTVLKDGLEQVEFYSDKPVLAESLFDEFWASLEKQRERRVIRSGIPTIDKVFPLLGDACLIALKARRGVGKTHFAVHLTHQATSCGYGVVWYTFEMSVLQVLRRLLARYAGVDSHLFYTHEAMDTASYCMAKLAGQPVWLCDRRRDVKRMLHELVTLRCGDIKPRLVIIDYLELVPPASRHETREQELASIVNGLGDIAREHQCTVLALSQVNKEGAERGSEALGNRADLLLHMQKDTYEDKRILVIEKNRHGSGGSVELTVNLASSIFREVTDDWLRS
jgi:replicative DNA helicase